MERQASGDGAALRTRFEGWSRDFRLGGRWSGASALFATLAILAILVIFLAGPSRAATPEEPAAAAAPAASASTLGHVVVRGQRLIDVGPLPGLAITKDQIPANIQSATKEEIKASRALNIADYMNTQMQGVSVNDYAGNPFQLDVNYRGFTASPQIGTPQGLSVFFDGVRVNEPFGDVVNWDLIPVNAIERFDVFPGSNPIFGLNTLGGAISVRTKSGFTAPGVEASVLGGSWGRRQLQLSGGGNVDGWAGFGALTLFHEKGWRDDSPSRVGQIYARGDRNFERGLVTASVLASRNELIGNGLVPLELYQQRPQTVYTSPDRSRNRLVQFMLSGAFDVTDTWNVTTHAYRRKSNRTGLNGDIYEGFSDMSPTRDAVPDPESNYGSFPRDGASAAYGGQFDAPGVVPGTPIGLLTSTSLRQTTDGFALQSNWNLEQHKFMLGASIDRSRASYLMTQRLGLIDAAHRVYGAPISDDPTTPSTIYRQYYAASHDVPGNDFSGVETTKSLYFSETWSARPNLHFTATARYNHTETASDLLVRTSEGTRELHELRSDEIDPTTRTAEDFIYRSFNPSVGVNWLPDPQLNLYGNLGRGARTPSVVELGCAFNPTPVPFILGTTNFGSIPASLLGTGCNLPTTLSGDPYLPQIRSTSGEVGARGRLSDRWNWNASVFRTDLKDDLYFVGVGDNRSYFDTIGKTRRQGFELGLDGAIGPFDMKLGYSYVDATFQSTFYTASPHNSSADFDQNSQPVYSGNSITSRFLPTPGTYANQGRGTYLDTRVDPGARLPGIPQHSFNGTVHWNATPALKLGLGVVFRSSSFVRGNENNQHQPYGSDQQTGYYYCNDNCTGSYQQLFVRRGRDFRDKGTLPSYTVFNLDGSYQVTSRFSIGLQVTNLFDRRYASAGRLGINPFSPSINGVIGPSGWNYNSSDWQSTTFVGPGAPRAYFLSMSYAFDAK